MVAAAAAAAAVGAVEQQEALPQWLVRVLDIRVVKVSEKKQATSTIWPHPVRIL